MFKMLYLFHDMKSDISMLNKYPIKFSFALITDNTYLVFSTDSMYCMQKSKCNNQFDDDGIFG